MTPQVSTLRRCVTRLQPNMVDDDTLEEWVKKCHVDAQSLQIAKVNILLSYFTSNSILKLDKKIILRVQISDNTTKQWGFI